MDARGGQAFQVSLGGVPGGHLELVVCHRDAIGRVEFHQALECYQALVEDCNMIEALDYWGKADNGGSNDESDSGA